MKNTKKILLLIAMMTVLVLCSTFGTSAITYNGIANNGLDGIYIDIYSEIYTSLAQVPTWGQYAYGPSGCAWFATSRTKELTGKNITTIYGGYKWYYEVYNDFGFSRGQTIRAKALACYENHVAVVEKVDGNIVTISEGGNTSYPNNDYCVIRRKTIEQVESGDFYGYVYFDGKSDEITVPTLSLDRHIYYVGDKVNISWYASSANSNFYQYWLIIKNTTNNKEYYGGATGAEGDYTKNSYTFTIPTSGTYLITVYAVPYNNENGGQKVATCSFEANTNEVTSPTIYLNKNIYYVGDKVDITWKATSANTDFYQYWLIIKNTTNNKEYYGGATGAAGDYTKNYYAFTVPTEGTYLITVYAVPYCSNSPQKVATEKFQASSSHIHVYNSKITKSSDCTSTGTKTFTCPCGDTYTETIAKLGHSYSSTYTVDKKATCTAAGAKSKHCTRSGCSAKTSVTAIEATGHKYDSGEVTEKATYVQTGTKTYTCTVCKVKKTEPIAKLKLGKTSKLTATPKSNEIKLTWKAVSGADGYRVYQYDYTKKKSDRLATITGTSYTIRNLKANTKYRFSVKAYSLIDGEKVWSDSYTIIETQTCPGVTNKITAVSTTTTIKLTWNKVSGATGYRVYRYNATEKKWVIVVNETTKTTATIKFKTGAKTKFAVKSYKKLGDGTILWSSSYKTIETATKTATPKISKLTSSSKGKAVITWTNVSGENGFQVYYSTKKNGDFKKYSNYKGNTTKAIVSKLKSGKTYYFKVRTYKTTDSGYVYSSWSQVKSVKIK